MTKEMAMEKIEEKPPTGLIVHDDSEFANLLDTAKFQHLWRVAEAFALSEMIPDIFKNKPANCFVALETAIRLGVHPLMYLQKSYVVKGKPGIEAQMAIALANTRGPFTGPIQWRFSGENSDRACTAYATHSITSEVCEVTVDWAMVEGEGWTANAHWKHMTDQMFRYRSAMFLIRAYCPEVIMGLNSIEELQDIQASVVDITPRVREIKKPVVTGEPAADPYAPKPAQDAQDAPGEAPEAGAAARSFAELLDELGATRDTPLTAQENGWLHTFLHKVAEIEMKTTVEIIERTLSNIENPMAFWEEFNSWVAEWTKDPEQDKPSELPDDHDEPTPGQIKTLGSMWKVEKLGLSVDDLRVHTVTGKAYYSHLTAEKAAWLIECGRYALAQPETDDEDTVDAPGDETAPGEDWYPTGLLVNRIREAGKTPRDVITAAREKYAAEGLTTHAEIEPYIDIALESDEEFNKWLSTVVA